jgi:hypothetical protein
MEQGVEEEQITVVSNDDGEDFRLEKTDMSSFFEIEPTKKNNKKKKKDVTIAAASISKSQLKKKKVDESTRMFFKDTATDKKSVAVAISTGTVDVLSKHVENLDIRDKEDLNKKSIQVDKTIAIDKEPEKPKVNDQVDKTIAIDKEPEKPKVNDQVESPTNLESINDDSENSSTTDGASTNTDMKENTESESQDEENEHSTSEVHSKDINDSNDNNESAEKEISDHIEKKNLSKGIQLTEELSKDLNDTAGSDNMHK